MRIYLVNGRWSVLFGEDFVHNVQPFSARYGPDADAGMGHKQKNAVPQLEETQLVIAIGHRYGSCAFEAPWHPENFRGLDMHASDLSYRSVQVGDNVSFNGSEWCYHRLRAAASTGEVGVDNCVTLASATKDRWGCDEEVYKGEKTLDLTNVIWFWIDDRELYGCWSLAQYVAIFKSGTTV